MEGRQRGQRLLRACVGLLAQALVLWEARLAEAVGGVHGGRVQGAMRMSREVLMGMRRDQLVLSVTISFDEPQVRATRVTAANAPTRQHKKGRMGNGGPRKKKLCGARVGE